MFEGPRLKIERAKCHIADLEREINAFIKANPYSLVIKRDIQAGKQRLMPSDGARIPDKIALIAGDAIHNLRASLDHLACDLVRLNGNPTEGVYFPFAKDANGLETQIKEKIQGASPEVHDIVRALKPYKRENGGNTALRALHDLDIADKHVALTPTLAAVGLRDFILMNGQEPVMQDIGIVIFPEKGAGFIGFPPDANIEIKGNPKLTADIALGEGQPFEHEPLIPTLHQLVDLIDGIVKTFEAHYS